MAPSSSRRLGFSKHPRLSEQLRRGKEEKQKLQATFDGLPVVKKDIEL